MKRLGGLLFALALGGCAAGPGMVSGPANTVPGWVGAWGASPTLPPATAKAFENQTLRQVVRLSEGGTSVRIRFTNAYGTKALDIGAATVALAGADGKAIGAPIKLTFGGQAATSLPPAAPLLSDPVTIAVKALDSLSISLFLPTATGPCTCHFAGTATTWISGPGNFTATDFEAAETFTSRAFISGVEVTSNAPGTIITFGDSITDGTASTANANHRWPDVLAERLVAAGQPGAISNQAIAGNRVLTQAMPIFGENALARFDRDVLAVPGARWLVVLEGINDIGMGAAAPPSAELIIAGYRQLIDRARARGMKVIFATLLPYEGARYFTDNGEVVRQKVNDWIRTTHETDGVVDFDAATRDPANPRRMKADLQSGDWLHPNDAGYKVMGDAVDLSLFR